MIPLWLLILLFAILLLATIGSYMANERQRFKTQLKAQVNKMRIKADDYQELASEIANLTSLNELVLSISAYAKSIYERIAELEPNNPLIIAALEQNKSFAEALESIGNSPSTVFSNEASIKHARSQLHKAGRLFTQLRERNLLAKEAFDTYHHELSWLYLQCEVDSLAHQGDICMEGKDKLKAINFYHKAKVSLEKAKADDPRHKERLDSLSEKIKLADSATTTENSDNNADEESE